MNPDIRRQYHDALMEWATRETELVEQARQQGDERALSLALMRRSMIADGMLHNLAQNLQAFAQCRDSLARRAVTQRASEDYDAAERTEIQMSLLDEAAALAARLETSHE